jgi:hypothetical protein
VETTVGTFEALYSSPNTFTKFTRRNLESSIHRVFLRITIHFGPTKIGGKHPNASSSERHERVA